MFKDARLQERIFDQIHAVEFNMEDDFRDAEVGSLLSAGFGSDAFERVEDTDAELEPIREERRPPEAHVSSFIDDVVPNTMHSAGFQRISDDEEEAALEVVADKPASKRARKPPAVHGENGVSVKAPVEGYASHYYSMTRLEASGTINGQRATGQAWMDHEFGSSALRENQQGWDWFSIQLDNDAELMLYIIRRSDGTPDVTSSGSLIADDGRVIHIRRDQLRITPTARWKSPKSGATYPMGWRVELPQLNVTLTLAPLLEDQELVTRGSTRITYWEGAVDVSGSFGGTPVRGDGYVEMTGYDKAFRAP